MTERELVNELTEAAAVFNGWQARMTEMERMLPNGRTREVCCNLEVKILAMVNDLKHEVEVLTSGREFCDRCEDRFYPEELNGDHLCHECWQTTLSCY
jgi:hypothetical protein